MATNSQAIHRPRGARLLGVAFASVLAVALGVVLGSVAGCSGNAPAPPPSGPLTLEALDASVLVLPGRRVSLGFRLHTEAGEPVAEQPVGFAIVDAASTPGSDAAGATLSTDSALTDGDGVAATTLTAGLVAMFHVRATAGSAQADVMVTVSTSTGGTVLVA